MNEGVIVVYRGLKIKLYFDRPAIGELLSHLKGTQIFTSLFVCAWFAALLSTQSAIACKQGKARGWVPSSY